LVVKSEGERTLGKCRSRWEDNIKMDLREIRCEVVDWIQLVFQKADFRNSDEPSGTMKTKFLDHVTKYQLFKVDHVQLS
jgi:hypothetical protein